VQLQKNKSSIVRNSLPIPFWWSSG